MQTSVQDATDSHADLPVALPVEMIVRDRETISELCQHAEGEDRETFALDALKIGVLALRQAHGHLDADLIRHESERLLDGLAGQLNKHSELLQESLTGTLKDYFDPKSGRFQERVQRLVEQDGELEQVLRRQVGGDDSVLCSTLSAHFGNESPLMKTLSPDQSTGLLSTLRKTIDEQLVSQREHVLKQFSLDSKESALSRFISELTDRQTQLSDKLHGKLDEVVDEFSLDNGDSALSRLVQNVDRAQRTITKEFSLDEENSALARLKREMFELLESQKKTNQQFQTEVKETLAALSARREEAERSTRHGLEFEDAVFEQIQFESQRCGDIATRTGNTTGDIKHCKVGDCVVELGPDSRTPGGRIVVEAKEKSGYNLAQALAETETARKNRDAEIGLFIFSEKSAPAGFEPLTRYDHDLVLVWDSEKADSDVYFRAALTLARALCFRTRHHKEADTFDFSALDGVIHQVEKDAGAFAEIETLTKTIQSNSKKILKRVEISRESLSQQIETLREKTTELKDVFATLTGSDG